MITQQSNNHERIIFLSVFLPYVVFVGWLISDRRYLADVTVFGAVTIMVVPVLLLLYVLIDRYACYMRSLLQDHSFTVRRGVFLFLAGLGLKTLFITLLFGLAGEAGFSEDGLASVNFYWTLVATFLMSIIYAGLSEGAYAIQQWQTTLIKTELLEKTYLQNKLRKLKEQVNPHFLFNSLNCLSSLITEDKERADKFLNEMSSVYRYLLNNNEESLSTVGEEIRFIQSYYHLQRTRYGPGIHLATDIDRSHKDCFIPTLTLQLLVENAIKHNAIMENDPLHIKICSVDDNALLVVNNILPKMVKPPSAKIGLSNIINKYQILSQPPVEIESNSYQFSVKIPLIRSKI